MGNYKLFLVAIATVILVVLVTRWITKWCRSMYYKRKLDTLWMEERYEEAEGMARHLLAYCIAENGESDYRTIVLKSHLGTILVRLGRLKEAESLLILVNDYYQCMYNKARGSPQIRAKYDFHYLHSYKLLAKNNLRLLRKMMSTKKD